MQSRRCSRRAGLTLIEVVAAIAIIGVILVGVVVAQARHTHQLAVSRQQIAAARAADELISGWWAGADGVPLDASGVMGEGGLFAWRTGLVANASVERAGARVVRVEVLRRTDNVGADGSDGPALFAVDLVVPDPDAEQTQADGPDADRRDAT